MAQPAFWLKVNKSYVIENFENLLDYVKRYNYDPEHPEDNTDFDETCRCLSEVVADINNEVEKCKLWEVPEFDVSLEKAVRIMATYVLVENKRGRCNYEMILALIRILIHVNKSMTVDSMKRFLRLSVVCISRIPLKQLSFNFSNILESEFSIGKFTALLSNTVMTDSLQEYNYRFSGKGCMEISEGKIKIAPMNINDYEKDKPRKLLDYSDIAGLYLKDSKKIDDINRLLELYPKIYSCLDNVKPVEKVSLKNYRPGNSMDVRIDEQYGVKTVVSTVDEQYNLITDKLFLDSEIYRIPREYFIKNIKPGDYLQVELSENPLFPFVLSKESLNDFVSEYFKEFQGEYVDALFYENFSNGNGTRWISDLGLFINVMGKPSAEVEEIIEKELPVKIRIEEFFVDKYGNAGVNGSFQMDGELMIQQDFDAAIFEDNAFNRFFSEYLYWLQPEDDSDIDKKPAFKEIRELDVVLIGRLLHSLAVSSNMETFEKVSTLILSMVALGMTGNVEDCLYLRHELDYMEQIVKFAQGASPMSLSLKSPEELENIESVSAHKKIVASLWRYKEPELTHASINAKMYSASISDSDKSRLVEELVNASNILYDKIDSSEINRIKKSIASKLGVDDIYKDINGEMPFFGIENETLEFKVSCAIPPVNIRTGSVDKDIVVQKWVILKAVCAFLNSSLGGELLIGVSDSGYACGLINDIDLLLRKRIISERTSDRLRTYIKNEIDRAFVTNDGTAKGTSITSGYVHCDVEKPKDNIEIIRIRVEPYPWDVVKIGLDDCPDSFKRVYCRTSGASTPLNSEGIRNLKVKKLQMLDKDDLKLARLLEAIDNKRTVVLKSYTSRNGKRDRCVEPHKILHDHNALQAFDRESKSMRLFKLSRFDIVDVINEKWRHGSLHKDFGVDIFGMMENVELPKENVVLKMTDYALCLLREEFPYGPEDGVTVNPNDDSDRKQFSWKVEVETFHHSGIARFILGLPHELKIESGERLIAFLNNIKH